MGTHTRNLFSLGLLTALLVGGTAVEAAESQQPKSKQGEPGKGLTVDDLARGVRSAVQNIEKEIPKMGAAVGKAVKSIGADSSEKRPSRDQPADKK